MKKEIQPYLHAKYKRVRDRVEKLNSRKIGLSSESSSGTEDSVAGSEDESSSHDYSKPSSSESNDFDDNLGYVPTENQPPKPNANDDDPEISLFRSNFLESADEKHRRMIKNPPNPCKEGKSKYCTSFETREQARYHYHLYHSHIYRAHSCSRDPSCGRKFHDEDIASEHNCQANVLEYISPKKKTNFIEDRRETRSRNDKAKLKEPSPLKRRSSPSLQKKKKKKDKKRRPNLVISDSEDDIELNELINDANKKSKPSDQKPKSSSSSHQSTSGPSQHKNDDIDQIDLTELDLKLENLSDKGDF